LKSIITVLHRALEIPYGDKPYDGMAFVPRNGKWEPIHTVHSVATLWAHVLELTHSQEAALKARCRTDWQDIPEGLDAAIAAIEVAWSTPNLESRV
jgi:hypothetical protein